MMLSAAHKSELRAKLAEMEHTLIRISDRGDVSIGTLAREDFDVAAELLISDDALMPVLRTALVINWPERAMQLRYSYFRATFPEITSLASLAQVMDSVEPLVFCKKYLQINAKTDQNPKFQLLKQLTTGFLEYQSDHQLPTEIAAMRHWAENVDIKNLKKNDHIGQRRGVGIGVVENIRRNLGMPVIKPDRHVIGVMKNWLQMTTPLIDYGRFADSLEVDRRYFDFVLFKFGQAKGISA